jgi:hypothetical protein
MAQKANASEFETGDWVKDAEDNDDPFLLVLKTVDKRADEKTVHETPSPDPDVTVADLQDTDEYNSDYLIKCVYRADLNRKFKPDNPRWSVKDVIEAYENGELTESKKEGGYNITVYPFPVGRVEQVDI